LWFGSAVHAGLADWYLPGLERGRHPAETFDEALEGDRSFAVTNEEEEKEYADARELGMSMLHQYTDFYGEDEYWDVIATEEPFRVWIPHPQDKGNKRWLRYVGTWDGVIRDRTSGEVWLLEHKTAASISPLHLPLDDQAGAYWAVATATLRKRGVLKPREEIAGILYNFLRKALPDTRPVNERGVRTNKPQKQHYFDQLKDVPGLPVNTAYLAKMKIDEMEELAINAGIVILGEESKQQPPPFFERFQIYRSRVERRYMIQRIQNEAVYAEAWRAGDERFPLYKTPVAMGPQACQHHCAFYRMCQLHEQGDDTWMEFRDTMFNTQDPYADHERKSA
jgi:hypothetical protein